MGCPTVPLSCLNPSDIFASIYQPHCTGWGDPASFQAEQAIYGSLFEEQIYNYGSDIEYHVNVFDVEKMNNVYGEHTTMYWLNPITIKVIMNLEEPSPIYSIAGFDSTDTLTIYMHIGMFNTYFQYLSVFNEYLVDSNGIRILDNGGNPIYIGGETRPFPLEPKAQDKIVISALGCNRSNGRGAKIYEVTDVTDQDVNEINPLMGHFVWRVKAVRSEYNSITNEPRELENNQISDSTFFGKLSSSLFPTLTGAAKKYTQNADDTVIEDIMPPSTSGNDGGTYGNYY
jgi:hypothetical protein